MYILRNSEQQGIYYDWKMILNVFQSVPGFLDEI